MESRMYYLDSGGQRWCYRPNTEQVRLIVPQDGYNKLRKVRYFEAIGNYAVCVFDYRAPDGRRFEIKGFAESRDEDGHAVVTASYSTTPVVVGKGE